jgi:signal transduction histidine kinase
VATELHDYLAQLLVLGLVQLRQAKQVLVVPPQYGHFIQKMEDVLNQSLDYTRTLVAELSPPVLRECGLATALGWLAEYMRRYNLTVDIKAPHPPVLPVTEAQGVLLFQSVRELLMNVAKHARADRATVRLHCQLSFVRLEIQDAGCGFDPLYAGLSAVATHKTRPPVSSSFGLFAIRERMKTLGGTFELESAPGTGTTATLILPVPTSPESGQKAVSSGQSTTPPPPSPITP